MDQLQQSQIGRLRSRLNLMLASACFPAHLITRALDELDEEAIFTGDHKVRPLLCHEGELGVFPILDIGIAKHLIFLGMHGWGHQIDKTVTGFSTSSITTPLSNSKVSLAADLKIYSLQDKVGRGISVAPIATLLLMAVFNKEAVLGKSFLAPVRGRKTKIVTVSFSEDTISGPVMSVKTPKKNDENVQVLMMPSVFFVDLI